MSEHFTLLLAQDFAELEAAAVAWHRLAEHCEQAQQQHRTRITSPLSAAHWQGADAESARTALDQAEQRLGVVQAEAAAIAAALDTVHERMAQAQRRLRAAVGACEQSGVQVGDDGLLTRTLPGQRRAELEHCQDDLDAAVADAATASDLGSSALHRLGGEVLTRHQQFGAVAESAEDLRAAGELLGLGPALPSHGNPAENKAWWDALPPAQQRLYLALRPDLIGALDGVPSTVRDTANRTVLAQRLDAARAAGDATRVAALTRLDARLSADDPPLPGRAMLLIGLDTAGHGQAVISVGNPDTARNTAVYVPGTGSSLASVGGDLDRVQRLVAASEKYGQPGDTAAVMWLGYDAPETIVRDATRARYAVHGAPALERYVDGLHATGRPDQHLTVVGHSYGTTLIGEAARRGHGLAAQDIVVAGSPGMHVQHARELHLDRHHVWAAGADGDPVIDAGLVHGGHSFPQPPNVPTSPAFGANIIRTGSAHGHSEYWNTEDGSGRPNESLENQARIITGRYAQTTLIRGTRPPMSQP